MSKKVFYRLFALLSVLGLILSACGTAPTPTTVNVSQNVTVVQQQAAVQPPAAKNHGDAYQEAAPTAQAPQAPAFTPIKWDNTCSAQSLIVGVTMKPLKEGSFTACVYNGIAANVTIPAGTLADLDLGGIYVAKGPATVDGVPNLTLRPQRTGTDAEACAQVNALTNYGQTLANPFTAQPYNFSCP